MNNIKSFVLIIFLLLFLFLLIINTSNKIDEEFLDPAGDSKSYISLAKSINEEKIFVRQEFLNQNSVETVRTPGYPFFLSLFTNIKMLFLYRIFYILFQLFLYTK